MLMLAVKVIEEVFWLRCVFDQ
uniref:Uncharacterized protein n=1 Tax=Anguilla anguilla TaxID=7936 RepID=A0A0E9W3V2_ANGAN